MERIAERVDSKFRFVLLSARRAEQIMRGAVPKVDLKGRKLARGAMEEILSGLVKWDYGPAPEPAEEETPEEDSEAETTVN